MNCYRNCSLCSLFFPCNIKLSYGIAYMNSINMPTKFLIESAENTIFESISLHSSVFIHLDFITFRYELLDLRIYLSCLSCFKTRYYLYFPIQEIE